MGKSKGGLIQGRDVLSLNEGFLILAKESIFRKIKRPRKLRDVQGSLRRLNTPLPNSPHKDSHAKNDELNGSN